MNNSYNIRPKIPNYITLKQSCRRFEIFLFSYFHNTMKSVYFKWRKEIIRFYSDRNILEISKDKIKNLSFR